MPIRLSGLNSGLDTDAIVQELVNAYSLKTQKYEKAKTKLEWKQDAWKDLNAKIYGLYTNVSNLRYSSAYNMRRTSVSDATKASVTASDTAVTGTQKLNIIKNAQAAYITGEKLEGDITAATKLSELGFTGDTTITVSRKDGTSKEITVNGDTKISDFVGSLKDAGLNASFDANNKRLFVSAKESGTASDFELLASDANGEQVLGLLGLDSALTETVNGVTQFTAAGAKYAAAYAFYNTDYATSYADIESAVTDYLAKQAQNVTLTEDNENYQDEIDAAKEENKNYQEIIDQKQAEIDAAAEGTDVTALQDEIAANQALIEANNTKIADAEAAITANKETITANETAMTDAPAEIADIAALGTEDERKTAMEALANKAVEAAAILADPNSAKAGGATKIDGEDAQIRLNGVLYESTSNTFSINGLTIDALGVTGDGQANEITITTTVDTQGIYDKIKDFLTEYNSVINEMTKLYNAESAKDYEPLTDEEKDAMSETEIEKWEDKIKGALLRRDSSLDGIMSVMINSMSQTFVVNGEKMSLGNFGIQTLGFLNAKENEQYAYHIDGDEDDENTSGKTDKLMAAIQEDPDQICEFMKQLTSNLYKAVDTKMKSTSLSSAYKVYNDKELDKQMEEYEDLIKKWEDKVAEQEDYYFDKFTQMEVALSKLQSQTNSLTGLLGQ